MSSILRPFKRRKVTSPPPAPEYKARLAKYNGLSTVEFRETFLAKDDLLSFKPRGEFENVEIDVEFYNVKDLPTPDFERCFELLCSTSRQHYENSEREWDEDFKREEMSEEDMKFILVRRKYEQQSKKSVQSRLESSIAEPSKKKSHHQNSQDITDEHPSLRDFGYISFKLDDDDTMDPRVRVPVVYVYEIHLGANLRALGIGKHLMRITEHIARQAEMEKVILSVFTVNEAAEQFYRKLGYVTDETSPQPKRTRKRLIPPQWLYLSLSTKETTRENQ